MGLGVRALRGWPGRTCQAQGASWDACTQTPPCIDASYGIKNTTCTECQSSAFQWFNMHGRNGAVSISSAALTRGWGRWRAGWTSCRHKLPDRGPVPISRRRSSKRPRLEASAADIALLGLLKTHKYTHRDTHNPNVSFRKNLSF